MCGIVGYWGLSDCNLIKKMLKSINHRGPDDKGYYADDNLCIGNVRLSIVDIKNGKQPVFNEDKSIVAVFNGEIYNFQKLKRQLISKGHKFETNCDTEVLVHLYEEHGSSFVRLLNGMFTFAIWDSNKKRLLLSRDRMGIKPLYYFYDKTQNIFIFGSEMKAILKTGYVSLKRDITNLHFYLYHGYSHFRRTPLDQIKKLAPGELVIIDSSGVTFKEYWQIPIKNNKKSYIDFKEDIKSILLDSINKRKMGDVPVSIFLSGGLDSSTVVALLSKYKDNVLNTFSVGFNESTDELNYAEIVAKKFNTNHKEIILESSEICKKIPKIIYHLEEPIADFAVLPFYFLAEKASKKFKVALLGEGSDEIFGGYSHYPIFSKKLAAVPYSLRKSIYNQYRSFIDTNKLDIMKTRLNNNYTFIHKVENPFYDCQRFDLKYTLPNFQLLRVDKLSMAHSLECRVPFLDHRLVENALPSPEEYKLNFLKGKKVLYDIMNPLLPKPIIKRRKKPFSVPIRKIYEKEIKSSYISFLENKDDNEVFKKRKILKLIENKKLRPNNVTLLYFYNIWENIFIDGAGINAKG